MSQAQNASVGAVSGLNPLSYLNPNYPNQVLTVGAARAPTTADKNYAVGTIWRDTYAGAAYVLVDVASGAANWAIASTDPAALTSLEAEAGDTSVSGSSNTILLAGTANQIITTGDDATHSITFSLDADVVITTSLDVPLIVPTGGDLTVQLGDNIGANYLAVENALGSRKILLDSAGVITAPQMQTTTDLTLKLSDGAGASSLYVVDDADVQKFRVISDGQVEVSNRIVSVVADLELAAAASSDVITTLGDTGGVNKLSVQNISNVEVASIASDGSIVGSLYSFTATYGMSGQTTLVAGTKTISNTAISANDVVILERTDVNGSTAIGVPVVTKSAGVGFTITAVQAGTPAATETNDISIFNYVIMRRA